MSTVTLTLVTTSSRNSKNTITAPAKHIKDNNGNAQHEKLDFAMVGYSMKLYFNRKLAHTAPRKLPRFFAKAATSNTTMTTATKKKKKQRRSNNNNNVYGVLWASGDLIVEPERDKSILVPLEANGKPDLTAVRNILLSAGKNRACVRYLKVFQKLRNDLRVFDLPTLGLQLICLPDPRPDWVLESKESKINIPLANDDNRMACTLLLAENDFDLTLIQDIFGPVLILLRPTTTPRDFKMKHMLAFLGSYLGLAGSSVSQYLADSFQPDALQELTATMFQPMPLARRAYKKQLKGKAPPTDLLSHAPESAESKPKTANNDNEVHTRSASFYTSSHCGNPKCPHGLQTIDHDTLMKCKRCRGVYYCCKTCQRDHWKKHKPFCTEPKSVIVD